ncbi:DUF6634 family protein [Nisaea sp.]|uniref:DUF6634 family protein n=1 Tax=Nisaea sp. TaxID=2024842 RepID=UPI00345525C7
MTLPRNPAVVAALRAEITSLERLAADLQTILDGTGPTDQDLNSAPIIDDYLRTTREVACLSGHISGHPSGPSDTGRTSELVFFSPKRGWARTRNRFYRLGGRFDVG